MIDYLHFMDRIEIWIVFPCKIPGVVLFVPTGMSGDTDRSNMKQVLLELLPTDRFPGWKGLPAHESPGRGQMGFHTDVFPI